MLEDIEHILTACAVPKNNDDRLLNEGKIREYKKEYPEQFVFSMTEQLNNSDLDDSSRHLAGVLFKNSVKSGDPQPFWFSLNDEQKNELRNRILLSLANESASVRLSGCS